MIASFPFLASSFDNDARTFINTSGATDRAAINYFVKGIKRLGLWDDMVCWPLRSAQNAGTGSTAYSLGGLGTYNGTLVNGPTWGVDGVDLNDLDRRITTSAQATQPDTIFTVQKTTAEDFFQVVYDGAQRQHLYREQLTVNRLSGFAGTVNIATTALTAGDFNSMQIEFYGGSSSSSFNNEVKVSRNYGANNLTSFRMGSGQIDQKGAVLAFSAIINIGSVPLLHGLYKSTLGQGLGLP
jgi:hypothetical protein